MNPLPEELKSRETVGTATVFLITGKTEDQNSFPGERYAITMRNVRSLGCDRPQTYYIGSEAAFRLLDIGGLYHIYYEKISA